LSRDSPSAAASAHTKRIVYSWARASPASRAFAPQSPLPGRAICLFLPFRTPRRARQPRICRRVLWREADSNRRHHDFQTDVRDTRTRTKALDLYGFWVPRLGGGVSEIAQECIAVQDTRPVSCPNAAWGRVVVERPQRPPGNRSGWPHGVPLVTAGRSRRDRRRGRATGRGARRRTDHGPWSGPPAGSLGALRLTTPAPPPICRRQLHAS
jgi:hypothetical protein